MKQDRTVKRKGYVFEIDGTHTVEEFVDAFGCHPDTVYKLIKQGDLESRKVGTRHFIKDESVIKYIHGAC